MADVLLDIKGLSVEYRTFDGVVKAVNNLTMQVERGKTIGLVGETGAGKTTTALSILRLIPNPPGYITSGEIVYNGQDLLRARENEMRKLRGNKISMIFQNPMTSLNPVLTIGQQITGVIRQHQNLNKRDAAERAVEMLSIVDIPEGRLNNYPHEFSGGMRQRVGIAMGLACSPELLIADEPTTALDVTIQAQILDLMNDLKAKYSTSIIFITHDLGVVADIADYVVVMYAGIAVEHGDIKSIYTNPQHPYTKGLFECIPDIDVDDKSLQPIQGTMPDPRNLPQGCTFYPRCQVRMDKCLKVDPQEIKIGDRHFASCHNLSSGGETNG